MSSLPNSRRVDLRTLEPVGEYNGHLMCPICHIPFVDPVQLSCDHIFCHRCLDACVRTTYPGERHRTIPEGFRCPACRASVKPKIRNAPRMISSMCDDIQVKCPYATRGCEKILQRGYVPMHVDRECSYRLVPCQDETCRKMIYIKDRNEDNRCLHGLAPCQDCGEEVIELSLPKHEETCPELDITCVDCDAIMLRREHAEHQETCPTKACKGYAYGCEHKLPAAEIKEHEKACPASTLGPFLAKQTAKLTSMDILIKQLQQRNEVLSESLADIRGMLSRERGYEMDPYMRSRSEMFDEAEEVDLLNIEPEADREPPLDPSMPTNTTTTTYLLSLHENLREEVTELKTALTALDARASMNIMNESLRLREDMAHVSAGLATVRGQVHMLVNTCINQGHHRTFPTRSAAAGPEEGNIGGLNLPGFAAFARMNPGGSQTPRRLSDSHNITKL